MIIDDILDEVDSMEDLANVYFDYLEGNETEEGLYSAITNICQYSYMVTTDDVVSCFYQGIHNDYTANEMLAEIFDFEGMMGYFGDDEIEEGTYTEANAYFAEAQSRVNFKFNKYLINA